MLLGGNRYGQAVVRILAVDDDGQIHVVDLVSRQLVPPRNLG
jgi:hypothetical protein